MGQIITVKCPKCGYSEKLNLGSGIRFNDLNYVLNLFDEDSAGKIREAVSMEPNSFWYVYKEIAKCMACKKITEIAVFKMDKKNGEKLKVISKCKCGNAANLYDFENVLSGKEELTCPLCGEDLKVEVAGNWD